MNDAWRTTRRESFPWGVLAYGRRAGTGPTWVLLHGGGCQSADWERVARRLPSDWPLVCPDFRGHGASAIPAANFLLDDLADDVVELVERLGLGRVVLVGHSLGGMVAKQIASARPDVVAALVMVEGWTHLRGARHLRQTMFGALSDKEAQAIREQSDRTFSAWPQGMHPAFWQSLKDYDAGAFMAHAELPVLEFYGDRGEPRPSRDDLGVPDRPNIRLVWLAGAGHYLLHGRPESIADGIASWMDDSQETPH